MGTNNNGSPMIGSIEVVTSGVNVTASAFSDAYLTTLSGTVTAVASSLPSAVGVGILLAPSSVVQGNTVGPFSAK